MLEVFEGEVMCLRTDSYIWKKILASGHKTGNDSVLSERKIKSMHFIKKILIQQPYKGILEYRRIFWIKKQIKRSLLNVKMFSFCLQHNWFPDQQMELVQTYYLNLSKLGITEFFVLEYICKMSQAPGKDTVVFFQNVFVYNSKKDCKWLY